VPIFESCAIVILLASAATAFTNISRISCDILSLSMSSFKAWFVPFLRQETSIYRKAKGKLLLYRCNNWHEDKQYLTLFGTLWRRRCLPVVTDAVFSNVVIVAVIRPRSAPRIRAAILHCNRSTCNRKKKEGRVLTRISHVMLSNCIYQCCMSFFMQRQKNK
jgi:hypothetical protein